MRSEISSLLKWLRDASIVVAISIALIAVPEAILRLMFPDKIDAPARKPLPEEVAYEFNEHYLVALKPDRKRSFTRSAQNGGDVIEWHTNADSFRGADLRQKPAARIIVYGDSNIEARSSRTENTYPFKLGEYLRKDGAADVEVVNAGVVGFGPDQSLIRFGLEAARYKPDLVVFHVFADNDFGDLVRNRLFDVDESGGLIETGHKREADPLLAGGEGSGLRQFASSLLIVKAIRRALRLAKPGTVDLAESKVDALRRLTADEYAVYKRSGAERFSHFADHYDIDIALDPDDESSKLKVRLMRAVLKQASDVAVSRGIGFLVLIQPSRVDLTDHEDINYKYLRRYPGYRNSRLTGLVEQICRESGIRYINLFAPFQRNRPNDLYFLGDDNHWNDRGQDLAARETAAYIVAHGMLAGKRRPDGPGEEGSGASHE